MSPELYYSKYHADNTLSDLSHQLIERVLGYYPNSVLDFGTGTGKHIKAIKEKSPSCLCFGLDVSLINLITANAKNDCNFLALGNESLLSHLRNFDVTVTCSVLDHIENIDAIINSFQQITNRAIILAETNDTPDKYYFKHNYESYGFQKMNFEWTSSGDGAKYHIWIWHNERFHDAEDFPAIIDGKCI